MSPSTAHQTGLAVLVTGGIHGSEYASIDAVMRLGTALDPKTVKGQVLCLPVMNPSAFWERTAYVSPIDNLNLNRVFPGKAKGSFSERLAYHLVEKAIRGADAYIDMHGGDVPEALVPFNIYHETGNSEVDAKSRQMAEVFGAPAVIVQRSHGAPVSGLAYATAAGLGVPAMIAEDGGAGQYDSTIAERMLGGLENVLRSLEVIPGTLRNLPPPRRFAPLCLGAYLRGRILPAGDQGRRRSRSRSESRQPGRFLWPGDREGGGTRQGSDSVHAGQPGHCQERPRLRGGGRVAGLNRCLVAPNCRLRRVVL